VGGGGRSRRRSRRRRRRRRIHACGASLVELVQVHKLKEGQEFSIGKHLQGELSKGKRGGKGMRAQEGRKRDDDGGRGWCRPAQRIQGLEVERPRKPSRERSARPRRPAPRKRSPWRLMGTLRFTLAGHSGQGEEGGEGRRGSGT